MAHNVQQGKHPTQKRRGCSGIASKAMLTPSWCGWSRACAALHGTALRRCTALLPCAALRCGCGCVSHTLRLRLRCAFDLVLLGAPHRTAPHRTAPLALKLRYPTVNFAFESGANTWAHACGADCDRAVAIALKADVTIAVVGDSLGTCGTPQCPTVPL